MKILFLDFDGVITTYESGWRIDLKKLELLDNIIKLTDAKIVVSSSWTVGKDNVDDFKDYLCSTWRVKTIGENDIFKNFVRQIYDITDKKGAWRGDEIQRWLDKHEDDVDTYAILDDDSDFHNDQLFHFVQTDTYEGLTAREVKLCTYILNNNKVPNPIRLNLELTTRWRNKCNEIDDGGNINNLLQEYYNKKFEKK